jgi:hypothetical protein
MLKEVWLTYYCVMGPSIIDLVYIRWSAMRDDDAAGNFHIVVIAMAFAIDHTTSKRVIRSTMLAADLEPGVGTREEAARGFSFGLHFLETELGL